MAWKESFEKGVTYFKYGNLVEALAHMNQAVELRNDNFTIYDSRAAVHEKLGNHKAALLDSKRVIELGPDRWQGYARSARLFTVLKKYSSSIKMADLALNRLRPDDAQRRTPLVELREQAITAQAAAEKRRLSHISKTSYLLGKLPVEILVQIFDILVSDDSTLVVRLSHICGHWRRIVFDSPSLWRTLVLSNKHPLRKVKVWKQGAKNRIASLSLSVPPLDAPSVLSELEDLSWEHLLSLRTSGKAFFDLHEMLSDISMLHVLSNLCELSLYDCASPDQLQCFLSGPDWKLRSLHLDGVIYISDKWWQHIHQLTELHICFLLASFSMRPLEANPSLERFVLDLSQPMYINENYNGTTPIPMNKLRSIELRNIANPFSLLRAITAPSITSFHLFNARSGVEEALLHITGPSLAELCVGNCGLDQGIMITVLSRAPNLENLQINSIHGVANEVLQFLARNNPSPDLPHGPSPGLPCPALKRVDVSRCSDLSTSSTYAFVKSRLQCGSEQSGSTETCSILESLKVDGCPDIDPDLLPWFRSKVTRFSCVYMTKKDLKRGR
ncbi:hypothetical protein PAXRUDRAFT_836024 [Paxillus rubicundulus Ve08.2h10]|uniref:Unplaced genomic scaffold scaffold_4216, whole genome shotgun sequence n=1 Tax=Paxillus rubicundulus Ve08.2h10 TaxID=930991 RepID=A0A0D0DAJ4_9AGAM|nr:hypothetical protein PAXRUDRAFT_836024 [Paxillus rubicundulus Ve08.2h10]